MMFQEHNNENTKQSKNNISILLILFLLLGQVVRVTIFQRRRDVNAYATVDETAFIAIVLVAAGCAVLFFSKNGIKSLKSVLEHDYKYIIFYYLFCGISAFWSTRIEYSLFRTIEMIVNALLVYNLFMLVENKKKALRILLIIVFFSTLFGLASYWRRTGITFQDIHSNAYPSVAAMGAILSIGLFLYYRALSLFEIIFGIIFFSAALFAGSSASSMVSTFIGLLLLNSLKKQGKISFLKLFLMVMIVLSIYKYAFIPAKNILFPGKSDQSIRTMTGRTGLWEIYVRGFYKKPILGWGFPTGEKEAGRFGFTMTSSSHNGLISVLINTGIIGLAIFLYAFMKIVTSYYRSFSKGVEGCSVLFAALAVGLINNNTYPLIGSQWFFPSTTFLSILAFSNFFIWNYDQNSFIEEDQGKTIRYRIRW